MESLAMAEMALMALSIVAAKRPSAVEADLSSDNASSRDCWRVRRAMAK